MENYQDAGFTRKEIKPIKRQIPLDKGKPLPKILEVADEAANSGWNKHLLTPLRSKEKVFVESNQNDVPAGYVRIKHGTPKVVSIFSLSHFCQPKIKA